MRVHPWQACRAGAHRKLLGTQESPHDGKVGELQQDHADVRARDRQREPNKRGEGRLHRQGVAARCADGERPVGSCCADRCCALRCAYWRRHRARRARPGRTHAAEPEAAAHELYLRYVRVKRALAAQATNRRPVD